MAKKQKSKLAMEIAEAYKDFGKNKISEEEQAKIDEAFRNHFANLIKKSK